MFQAMGIAMILFACIAFSYLKVDALKQQYENLKALRQALLIIKNEISFSSIELSEAAMTVSNTLSGEMASVFSYVADYLSEHEMADFAQAWEEAKKCAPHRPILSVAADKTMTDFARRAGKMSREIEMENIDKTLSMLESELTTEGEQYIKNKKLIYTLGVGVGLAVLILFI